MVLVAVFAFEVWFFFFSSSLIDQRSGRWGFALSLPRGRG